MNSKHFGITAPGPYAKYQTQKTLTRNGFGLPRDAPPIFTGKMMEEWKKRDKQFEELPAWVEGVPPVRDLLAIPHWENSKRDFVTLTGFQDEGSSPERRPVSFHTGGILGRRLKATLLAVYTKIKHIYLVRSH
ncbi:hypothetical protein CCM_03565 [Cordyceps militaris CM01]|uniref:Uncharacterized protein n=1 Tax=Cordyceps militaris (strain CM01) TaxID=983644 RepID=G3JBI8_CORMM|nr:uncharacterized protein CCM_03565 [Cordyceps militaris CM01]EGX95293.1 hypothetical protein CCM_03565 [Cordyceps militaris CM01]